MLNKAAFNRITHKTKLYTDWSMKMFNVMLNIANYSMAGMCNGGKHRTSEVLLTTSGNPETRKKTHFQEPVAFTLRRGRASSLIGLFSKFSHRSNLSTLPNQCPSPMLTGTVTQLADFMTFDAVASCFENIRQDLGGSIALGPEWCQ